MNRAHSRSRLKNAGVIVTPPVPFTPAALFAGGAQGVWFDPSDLSSMFQDAAGTIPVTGPDQVVGLIRDKSGRGNHASQAVESAKPLLRISGGVSWLEFDGVDDSLATAAIPFTATAMYTSAAVRKASDAAIGVVLEHSANIGNNDGTFIMLAPATAATGNYLAGFKGTIRKDRTSPSTFPAPLTSILGGQGDIPTGLTRLRINGAVVANDTSGIGTGTFLSYPMFIGRRGSLSLPFAGNIYQLVVASGAISDDQVAANEAYLTSKTVAP